jgi:hypothetical protein
MIQLMPIALIAWFPIAILVFAKLPTRRALIACVLGAVMFLPMGELQMPLIAGRKDILINIGLLIAALLMDPAPLLAFRPRLLELPMILLSVVPFVSTIANGLSPYNAFAMSLSTFLTWGVPYLLGRAYFTDVRALWQLAWGIFVAGLIYAPGCILEMFLGPNLHLRIYGDDAFRDYQQSIRLGGFRPVMFMQHGLMVGTFMCTAALCGIWLWRNKAGKRVFFAPMYVSAPFLLLVAIACKSAGAVLLMFVALAVLFITRALGKGFLVYVLVSIAPVYIFARTVGGWTGSNAVQLAGQSIDREHAGSLQVRFDNENVLIERGMMKPLFGWGPNGDFLVKDDTGRVVSIPDGLWVIAFGSSGLVGLAALFGAMLVPTFALMRRFPARTWRHPAMAAPAALAVFLPTYAIDCLMNAMINPVWMVALGAVAALAVSPNPYPRPAGRPRPQPARQKVQVQQVRSPEQPPARPAITAS